MELDDFRYGYGSWKPRWIQFLNKAAGVVTFFSIGNCFQSMVVNGLLGVVLSTLERRFNLSSTQSSWMASAYEIGSLPVLLILSYAGTRLHRPITICCGLLTVSLGSLLFFIPHFVTPEYQPRAGDIDRSLCIDRMNMTSPCDESISSESFSNFLPLFIFARILHGIGSTPLYIVGVTFMDDIMTKENFSLYISIFYSMGVIGPAIGTIGGGFMLNLFTDFRTIPKDRLVIDNADPRWVGAWWLPYVIGTILLALIAFPIGGYARDVPGASEIRKQKKSEAHNADQSEEQEKADFAENLSEVPGLFKQLFTNPAYMMLTLFTCCDSLIIAGFTSFGPKYLENQFSLKASMAGPLFGIILLPAGAGGTIIGGVIIERLRLRCNQILKAECVLTFFIILLGFVFFFTCDNLQFAGVTVGYNDTMRPLETDLFDQCNSDCMCENLHFNPICSHDNVRYFSPCHAGCQASDNTTNAADTQLYYDCTCIVPPDDPSAPWATDDECTSQSCRYLPAFLALFFVEVLLIFMCNSMNITATVRSVSSSQRSLAIGLQWILLRLLGSIPGPVVFGAAFDGACLLWDIRCGRTGSCLYYQNSSMGLYVFLLCAAVKIPSLGFILTGACLYKSPRDCVAGTNSIEVSDVSTEKEIIENGNVDLKQGQVNPAYVDENKSTKF